jgi:predicted N-acetyltransferase YhbS
METIRRLTRAEFDDLQEMLDITFASHAYHRFSRFYTNAYSLDTFSDNRYYIAEIDNRIAAHVAVTPVTAHVGKAEFRIGAIGGVATLPEFRRQGLMSRLMEHSIGEMNREGIPVAALGGRRLRYANFGFENAGSQVRVTVNLADIAKFEQSGAVKHVSAEAGAETVGEYYSRPYTWIERTNVLNHLSREDCDTWVADDGYAAGSILNKHLVFEEIYSEQSILAIAAKIIRSCSLGSAEIVLGQNDPRLPEIMPSATGWSLRHSYLFRMNDSLLFLQNLKPLLAEKLSACNCSPFSLGITIEKPDAAEHLGIEYSGGDLSITVREGTQSCRIGWQEWVRLLMGGPVSEATKMVCRELFCVLPLNFHYPILDSV